MAKANGVSTVIGEDAARQHEQARPSGDVPGAEGERRDAEDQLDLRREIQQPAGVERVGGQQVDAERAVAGQPELLGRDEPVHRRARADAGQQHDRLARAGARRLEDGRHPRPGREPQAVDLDHLLAQRDDERRAQNRPADRGQRDQPEVGAAGRQRQSEQEQDRNGEDDAGVGDVDRRRAGLRDVGLEDGAAPQHAPQDAEAEHRGDGAAADGEPDLQPGVT